MPVCKCFVHVVETLLLKSTDLKHRLLQNLWSISKTDVRKFMTLDLPPSKQHWVTTATLIETHELQNFICGDRMGSVFLYKLDVTSQVGKEYYDKPAALIKVCVLTHANRYLEKSFKKTQKTTQTFLHEYLLVERKYMLACTVIVCKISNELIGSVAGLC